jgi:WD40 repeat protein
MNAELRRNMDALIAAGDHEGLTELALALFQGGDLPSAETAAAAAVTAGSARAHSIHAIVLDLQERPVEAEAAYRAAMAAGDESAIINLADMLMLQPDRYAEMEVLLRRAIDQQVINSRFVLGKVLRRQPGREQEAEEVLASETHPQIRSAAQLELGWMLATMPGREADAERAFRASDMPDAHQALAALLWRVPGREKDLIDALRQAAEGNVAHGWNNLIVELKARGLTSAAEAAYRDGLARGETDLRVHFGEFLRVQGRLADAEEVLRAGLADDRRCALVLGVLLMPQAGRMTEARELLITAAGAGLVNAMLLLARPREPERTTAGRQQPAEPDGERVDSVAERLLAAKPPGPGPIQAWWWDLVAEDLYVREHLIAHLIGSGRRDEAETVATDIRWVEGQVRHFGPAAASADLALISTPRADRLHGVIARTAHLLAPTEPPVAVADILRSRVAADPDWGPQIARLAAEHGHPALVNRWTLPDLPDPAFERILVSYNRPSYRTPVHAMVVAPDGTWIASTAGRAVDFWDVTTDAQRGSLPTGHTNHVAALAISRDGTVLVSAGGEVVGRDDMTVRIWDLPSRSERAVLTGHTGKVHAVAIAPDGTWLVSGSGDTTVRIWDTRTGQQKAVLATRPHRVWTLGESGESDKSGWVHAVAIAPDGSWFAAGDSHGEVQIWDAGTFQEIAALNFGEWVVSLAVAPDGRWLAVGGHAGPVRVLDTATWQERIVLTGHTDWVRALAVSPDGERLASGSEDCTIRIWDTTTGQELTVFENPGRDVNTLVFAPDGSWLASGDSHSVRIWDAVPKQHPVMPLGERTEPVLAVAVAPDGSWLATTGQNEAVRTWDASTGRQLAYLYPRITVGRSGWTGAVVISPDGRWLASGESGGFVQFWDAARVRPRKALEEPGSVDALAVAPDGSWLASGGDRQTIRIWDVLAGRERMIMTVPKEVFLADVRTLGMAPDGSWLASAGYDRKIRIWDTATGRQRGALTGHDDKVNALAVAPDGSWLASAGYDKTICIWDMPSGRQRAVLAGHAEIIWTVAITPDGRWIASADNDATIRIWDATDGRAIALMRVEKRIRSCAWLGSTGLVLGGDAGLYMFDFKP